MAIDVGACRDELRQTASSVQIGRPEARSINKDQIFAAVLLNRLSKRGHGFHQLEPDPENGCIAAQLLGRRDTIRVQG